MKLFRKKRTSENDEEDKELVLKTVAEAETDAEAGAPTAEAGASPPESSVGPPPNDLLAQIAVDAAAEVAAEENPPEGDRPPPQPDDPLDPGLMDLFREAKNEVQETTLASELADIPIQELLGDLVSLSEQLGVEPRARPTPSQQKTPVRDPELDQGSK